MWSHAIVKFFGILQIGVLFFIFIALYLRYKRNKELENADHLLNQWDAINKLKKQNEKKEDLQIGSVFPNWTPNTAPHEILSVSEKADAVAIEAAYKTMLKKYHPDRFAHWGKDYQQRAHAIVLFLQKARDELLKKINL